MKKLLPFVSALLLISACCKEKEEAVPQLPQARCPYPLVKTERITYDSGEFWEYHYYYDSLWRLIRKESTSSYYQPRIDSFKYYAAYFIENVSTYRPLNTQGYLIEDFRKYTYNTFGNMVYAYNNYGNGTYEYDNNHNLITSRTATENFPNYMHDYDTFYYNNYVNTTGNRNRGQEYLGVSSVNLVDYCVGSWYITPGSDPLHQFVLYNYTYNDSGWVSRLDMTRGDVARDSIDPVTFTYDTSYYLTRFDYTYY